MRDTDEACLKITAEKKENNISLCICDNGTGIGTDEKPHVFEPFFSTRKGKVGTGLFLVRKIVEDISGKITFDSKPGMTCFSVVIPSEQ